MKQLDCTASIVIYNNPPEIIRRAAESFLSCQLNVELHIVDNSQNRALKSSLTGLPVIYHFHGCNSGYGRGHNKALNEVSGSRYHVIMNPDVIVGPSVVKDLSAFMDDNPDIGMACPRVLSRDGILQPLNKRYPTVIDLFLRRFIPDRLRHFFQQGLDHYEMVDRGYDEICDVEFMTGCFMFCRTHVLKEVGGFDPRYFLYFEDCDLGRKFQQAGYRTTYYPYATITHYWERASHKSIRMTWIHIVNMIRYFNKWGWKFF